MARPKKQTVDYFPHIANSGKTIFILESKFGNDGYAFWFKLLELLATTDGHVYDCRNSAHWQFLLAKTQQNDVSARSILDLLSELDAIDSELWDLEIVWSQNFVDNIADVYKNRKAKAPTKPSKDSFYEQKPKQGDVSTSNNSGTESNEGVSTDKNPQSKVKETKVNESKGATTDDGGDNSPKKFNALSSFEQLWAFPNFVQVEDLNRLIDQHSDDLVTAAIKLAGSKDVKKGQALSFVESALREWSDNNVTTVEQAREYQKNRNKQFKKNDWSNKNNSNARQESLPNWAGDDYQEPEDEVIDDTELKKRLERIRAREGAGK